MTSLTTLPLIFLSGVLGTAHCLGMCGGIAATVSLGAPTFRSALCRQLCWSFGRTFTYAFLGMMAATAGSELVSGGGRSQRAQSLFAICAGLFLVVQGLGATGWLRLPMARKSGRACLSTSLFATLLRRGSTPGAFLAGVMTGFLPCGLVYSFLALAASSAHVGHGLLIMLAFGLGTVPLMVLSGTGLSLLSLPIRRHLVTVAAWCLLATGMITLGRGVAFAAVESGTAAPAACPFCTRSD